MSPDPRPLRRSLVIALVAGLIVLAGGLVYAVARPVTYTAETSLLVIPTNTLDSAAQSQFYSTLSNGQVVPTMAEVAGDGRFAKEAEKALGLSADESSAASVSITAVTDTSVLLVDATASSKTIAENLADRTAALAATYLHQTLPTYSAQTVRAAQGTGRAASASSTIVIAGTLVAALAVAVAAQQASYPLLQGRRRERPRPQLGTTYVSNTAA